MPTPQTILLNLTRVAERAVEFCHAVKVRPSVIATAARDLEKALNPNGYARANDTKYRRCAILCPGDWPETIPAQFSAIRRLKDALDDGADPVRVADAMIPDAAAMLTTLRHIWDNEHVDPAFARDIEQCNRSMRYSVAMGEKLEHRYMVAT